MTEGKKLRHTTELPPNIVQWERISFRNSKGFELTAFKDIQDLLALNSLFPLQCQFNTRLRLKRCVVLVASIVMSPWARIQYITFFCYHLLLHYCHCKLLLLLFVITPPLITLITRIPPPSVPAPSLTPMSKQNKHYIIIMSLFTLIKKTDQLNTEEQLV